MKETNYSTGDFYHYAYDSAGNRLTQESMVNGREPALSGGEVSTVNSAYDSANRLTSVDGITYTFDANGNLLNDGANIYTYDSANRLTAVSGPSSVVSYAYNGLGDRLSQTVDGNTTNYVLDLNAGLTQLLSNGTNAYLYGNSRIAQTGSSTEYFLGDALGSVRQLTNNAGEVTYAKAYFMPRLRRTSFDRIRLLESLILLKQILLRYPSNQSDGFWRDPWLTLRLPPPIPTKQFPMPAEKCIRLNDNNRLLPEFGKTGRKHE